MRRGTASAHSRYPDPLLVEASTELEGEALARHVRKRQLDASAAEAQERWVRFFGGGGLTF